MINQMSQNENTQNQFSNAVKELQIGKMLRKANITKSHSVSAYEVFNVKKPKSCGLDKKAKDGRDFLRFVQLV